MFLNHLFSLAAFLLVAGSWRACRVQGYCRRVIIIVGAAFEQEGFDILPAIGINSYEDALRYLRDRTRVRSQDFSG